MATNFVNITGIAYRSEAQMRKSHSSLKYPDLLTAKRCFFPFHIIV